MHEGARVDQELAGKVAVITGGGSGIGWATAELLLARGASVMIGCLDRSEVDQVCAALDTFPDTDVSTNTNTNTNTNTDTNTDRVAAQIADVRYEDAVGALIDSAARHFGGLDILVTAAGVQRYGNAVDTTSDEWDDVLSINLRGCFYAVKHALPHLRSRGTASIVVVSSVQAFVTQTDVAAYTASKGALNALARSIAVDEAAHGIRVNAVCPGSVDTPMLRASARRFSDGTDAGAQQLIDAWGRSHPLGRVARASEVAEVIVFLASDRAAFVTGAAIPVDGGLIASVPVALPST